MPDRGTGGSAIIGMAAVFPGAPDITTYWRNIERGFDAIIEAPADRYDPLYYDPTSTEPDRLYCRRGGFLEAPLRFDALAFGVMPVAARGAEPDQLLALEVAARALADAGYADKSFARDRAEVILGRGGYLTPGVARFDQRVRSVEQIAVALRAVLPGLTDAELEVVRADLREQLGPFGADSAIGLVPNLAASRIANRLDLHGGAYTIDAACASALVAVHQGVRDLDAGDCDLVIAGGVHLCHDPTFWSVFCQLGALSRSERIRPFDRRADGLLIGEGIGIVVLKRVADAERDGDRVYAVVRGSGMSSDGREASLMNPGVEGQLLALRRAWDAARLDPATVGLIEAHGTGTPTGDAAELQTLARFFGPAPPSGIRAGLGSVKSMIGHTMPAAGAAGLIKAALAIHHGVLPPTLHADEPRAGVDATRFRLIPRAEPWRANGSPRRAGVNAFGFGGINAHVVLEVHEASRSRTFVDTRARAHDNAGSAIQENAEQVLLVAAASTDALVHALDAPSDLGSLARGPCRLALFRPTPERLAKARAIAVRGEAWRGRDDIWFAPSGLLHDEGRLAFLFPGVDSSFEPQVEDVARHFGLSLRLPKGMTELGRGLSSLKATGMGIIAVGRLLDEALRALGVRADVMAGHSIGEWSGMIASGTVPAEAVDAVVESLVPEPIEVPGVVFVAAGCGLDKANEAIAGLDGLVVSHDNCPHQVILCGREAEADVALERLLRAGVLAQKLPFRSGYHSPVFADFVAPHRRVLTGLPLASPRLPLWSATTCAPYPADPDLVRQLAVDHLVRPVRFRELTLALYEQGVRVFVQVGTGSLIGFVDDTLRGRPHLAIAANVSNRTGLAQLRRLAAALFVEGAELELARVGLLSSRTATAAALATSPRAAVELSLGVPLLVPRAESAVVASVPTDAGFADDDGMESDEPVAAEFAAGMFELAAARDDVLLAWQGARGWQPDDAGGSREMERTLTLSLETFPELVDHAFYRQAPGFGDARDRYPVAPMTMILSLMMDAARELVPELVPIGLEAVRAFRWLSVAPPVEVTLLARFDGESRVEVTLAGYASGTVELATDYPEAPPKGEPLDDETPAQVSSTELYADRWMFHGPAYQGIVELGPLAKNGIRGVIAALPAKGALLDNAGQLLGYWVMQQTSVDRVAMPVMISSCRFFAPDPSEGELVDCVVRVRELGAVDVRADVELSQGGRVWAVIEGWEDKRFDADQRVWSLFRYPEHSVLTVLRESGYGILIQPWRSIAARDLLIRRYLDASERDRFATIGPRAQREWLLGRMAIKDCVRLALWARGHGPLFPAEIAVDDVDGRLVAHGPFAGRFTASVAHKDDLTIVYVAENEAVGVAALRIAKEGADLEHVALASERALLPDGADLATWATRLAVAKEALAKRLFVDGKGFAASAIEGERILIEAERDRAWVETRVEGAHVVGWSMA